MALDVPVKIVQIAAAKTEHTVSLYALDDTNNIYLFSISDQEWIKLPPILQPK